MLDSNMSEDITRQVTKLILALTAFLILALAALVLFTPLGAPLRQLLDSLFAASSVQAIWYVTRAAGIVAYLLLWLSTVWGLVVTNKIFDPILPRNFAYDAHEFLSLLAIGFTVLHVGVLLADKYLPFSAAQILVPFIAPYRPAWIGIGVIGLYLTLLVTITFYIRRWIGVKAFRVIHYLSFISYVAVTLHSWFSGTDTPLAATQWMYIGTALVVIFLTVYRVVIGLPRKSRATV